MILKKHAGLLFVILTYLITWSVEVPAAMAKHGYVAWKVSKGLQTICTLAPGIVALFLTAILFKKTGLKVLLKDIVKWRVKAKWYAVVILLGVGLCGLSLLLYNWISAKWNNPDALYNFIFYFLLILPLSALWEEIGWRGFLLPELQRKYSALKSSLVIGFVWGLWHLPIYLALDTYGDKTIAYFFVMFVACFALSILLTWLYNETKGSLLICILLHNAINTSAVYFFGNLEGAEFKPLIILMGLLTITAICVCFKLKGNLSGKESPESMIYSSAK